MKLPRVAFDKESLLDFLLNHGEKVVAALFALFACGLAWGGVEALRNMRPSEEQRPETIVKQAASNVVFDMAGPPKWWRG